MSVFKKYVSDSDGNQFNLNEIRKMYQSTKNKVYNYFDIGNDTLCKMSKKMAEIELHGKEIFYKNPFDGKQYTDITGAKKTGLSRQGFARRRKQYGEDSPLSWKVGCVNKKDLEANGIKVSYFNGQTPENRKIKKVEIKEKDNKRICIKDCSPCKNYSYCQDRRIFFGHSDKYKENGSCYRKPLCSNE